MRVYVRYEIPNKDGETRRERNERVGEITPEFHVPNAGMYLWRIYMDICASVDRIVEGAYRLIPPSEYSAWFRLTDTLVYPLEYDILIAMDRAYCEEANKEIEDVRSRRQEQQQKEIEQSRKRGKRG